MCVCVCVCVFTFPKALKLLLMKILEEYIDMDTFK